MQEKQALTIELEELGIERGRDGFVIWIMLKENSITNDTVKMQDTTPTYASRYGCASASSTVIRFLGSNVYKKLSSAFPITEKQPTKVFVKKSTANGFAFGNNCANGLRFRKGNARI